MGGKAFKGCLLVRGLEKAFGEGFCWCVFLIGFSQSCSVAELLVIANVSGGFDAGWYFYYVSMVLSYMVSMHSF